MPDQPFFSIIDYAVDNATTQRELIDGFADIQRNWVRSYPGYRGARIFASVDGRRVYNVIEWASREDFDHFEQTSDTAGRVAAIQAVLDGVSGTVTAQMTGPPRFRLARQIGPEQEAHNATTQP